MTLPLHERIRREIEGRILSGALAPGDRLPTEATLMREHGCARMTVNKALSALSATGLVERRKKAGTFVARPRVNAMVLDVPDLASAVVARGQAYTWRLTRRVVRTARDEAERALAGEGRLLAIEGVHLADAVPLAVERRLVALAAVPGIAEADLDAEPPGTWLLHHIPWTEAETRIAAVAADAATALLLDVSDGSACLSISRATWRGAEPVTRVEQVFVGAAYDLVARFGPAGR